MYQRVGLYSDEQHPTASSSAGEIVRTNGRIQAGRRRCQHSEGASAIAQQRPWWIGHHVCQKVRYYAMSCSLLANHRITSFFFPFFSMIDFSVCIAWSRRSQSAWKKWVICCHTSKEAVRSRWLSRHNETPSRRKRKTRSSLSWICSMVRDTRTENDDWLFSLSLCMRLRCCRCVYCTTSRLYGNLPNFRFAVALRRILRKGSAQTSAQGIMEDCHAHHGEDHRFTTHDRQERKFIWH